MAELALYLSQMRFMRVWYNFLRPISKFGLISMAPIANRCRNLIFGRVLFVATLTRDTSDFVFIR
jgi:hypothetical protein